MSYFRQLSRDSWLAIGLFVTLILITAVSLLQQTRDDAPPPYASFSNAPDGTRALQLWLESLGYTIAPERITTFAIATHTDIILMLQPNTSVNEREWETLDRWVDSGGTLILAGNNRGTDQALSHYEFSLSATYTPTLTSQTPLFQSPPLTRLPEWANWRVLQTERTDFVTHLASGTDPVLVSFPQGDGHVIISGNADPFTNNGLQQDNHPTLVLNLLAAAPDANRVWFNEWHHGVRLAATSNDIIGPVDWMRRTPTGWALLYIGIVLFAALLLQGRQFGRPVVLEKTTTRRTPLEYITAVANMSRRAGHRKAVMADYHDRLKRKLGQRYRLNPQLPDTEFVARYSALQPDTDATALLRLLNRLSQSNMNEDEMVNLAAEAADWLQKRA